MLCSITTAALVVPLGLIAVWTGLWALATKLNHGSWHVRIHLTIASVGAALCAWGYWLAGLVAFAAQWSAMVRTFIAVHRGGGAGRAVSAFARGHSLRTPHRAGAGRRRHSRDRSRRVDHLDRRR